MIKVANRSDLWFILLMNLLLVTASGVHELSEEGESYGPIKPINCTFGIPFQLEEGQTLFLENGKNQTACGHPTLKDGVCFGPHALTPAFMESRNRRVFVAQIPQICTTESRLSVSPEIPQYSA